MVFLWGSKLDKMEIVMAYWGQKMGVAHLTQWLQPRVMTRDNAVSTASDYCIFALIIGF